MLIAVSWPQDPMKLGDLSSFPCRVLPGRRGGARKDFRCLGKGNYRSKYVLRRSYQSVMGLSTRANMAVLVRGSAYPGCQIPNVDCSVDGFIECQLRRRAFICQNQRLGIGWLFIKIERYRYVSEIELTHRIHV